MKGILKTLEEHEKKNKERKHKNRIKKRIGKKGRWKAFLEYNT
jgi:hypothetical protein